MKSRFNKRTLLLGFVIIVGIGISYYSSTLGSKYYEENISVDNIPVAYMYNKVVLRLTLTNGTHLIQSALLYNEYTSEITEIEHFLFKIVEGEYKLIGNYAKLTDIPNYETFQ